jgi:hypothetical protein
VRAFENRVSRKIFGPNHRVRAFENRVSRRIFGPKGELEGTV